MDINEFDNSNNFSVSKFEIMLKSNKLLFFDSNEFENIISHYLENGKISLAKKAINLGLEQHPDSINLMLFKIEIFIFDNKLEKADKLLNSLEIIEPSNEELFIQRANIFSKKKLHNKAISTLSKALNISDNNAEIFSLIGVEYLFLEDFENAKKNFLSCLYNDKFDYSCLYNVIYCFDILKQNKQAISFLNDYLNRNPYCEIAWHQLGKQYFIFNEYEKAITAFDFAIISDEFFIGAYIEKGKTLEKLKRFNEAIINYKIIIALKDESNFPLFRIGICYEKLGNKNQAINFYKDCLNDDPLMDKAWYALANIQYNTQDYNKSLYSINKALEISIEKAKYWRLYSKVNIGLSLYEEADIGFQKIINLGEADESIWLSKVDMVIKIGEFNYAIDILKECFDLFEDKSDIEYRLSGIYFLKKEVELGIKHFKKGLILNQKNYYIFKELFPTLFNLQYIQSLLKKIN